MAGQIVVLDEGKMLEKIQAFPSQLEKAWTDLWIKDLPIETKGLEEVIICGMGGSGIAGQLAVELLQDSPIPVTVWADYGLPNWVNEKTLVIGISFSGNTEETVDAVKAAVAKKAKLLVITTGGKLEELSQIHGFPAIEFADGALPRAAIGWLYGFLITALTKLKLTTLTEDKYFQAVTELKHVVDQKAFLAKAEDLAISLNNKVPVVMTHAPLTSVATRWVNQFNENSKTFAVAAVVPELCHNFLVGLDFSVTEKLAVFFIESKYGFSRNVVRKKIIQKVLTQKGVTFTPVALECGSLLAEQLLFIYFGDLISYYLAGVNGVDPSPIEAIDFLKTELAKA